jgi:hypothetical protein
VARRDGFVALISPGNQFTHLTHDFADTFGCQAAQLSSYGGHILLVGRQAKRRPGEVEHFSTRELVLPWRRQ